MNCNPIVYISEGSSSILRCTIESCCVEIVTSSFSMEIDFTDYYAADAGEDGIGWHSCIGLKCTIRSKEWEHSFESNLSFRGILDLADILDMRGTRHLTETMRTISRSPDPSAGHPAVRIYASKSECNDIILGVAVTYVSRTSVNPTHILPAQDGTAFHPESAYYTGCGLLDCGSSINAARMIRTVDRSIRECIAMH
jgi:hypothetical protein